MTKKGKENKGVKETKEELKIFELEKKIEELENNWKRSLADYLNLEKRMSEEKVKIYSTLREQIIKEFLEAFLNMEMLSEHINNQGFDLVLKSLRTKLFDMGLNEINALGQDFDPLTMEAVSIVEGEENKVIEVLSKGYLLNGNLIRPAKVNVGRKNMEESKNE